tara:strand:- start:321 stop:470 length:150 start_codon:yes stop_codon:yes gene_type:complete
MSIQNAIKWNKGQLANAYKDLADAEAEIKWCLENLAALGRLEDLEDDDE